MRLRIAVFCPLHTHNAIHNRYYTVRVSNDATTERGGGGGAGRGGGGGGEVVATVMLGLGGEWEVF